MYCISMSKQWCGCQCLGYCYACIDVDACYCTCVQDEHNKNKQKTEKNPLSLKSLQVYICNVKKKKKKKKKEKKKGLSVLPSLYCIYWQKASQILTGLNVNLMVDAQFQLMLLRAWNRSRSPEVHARNWQSSVTLSKCCCHTKFNTRHITMSV